MSAMKFHGEFMNTSCRSRYIAQVFFMACDSKMVLEFIPYSLEWNETYSYESSPVKLIEPWRPKRRQSIITVLTTLARKHQCTTAITTMLTQSL